MATMIAPVAPAYAQLAGSAASGVVSYPPDFFSQAQPQTALDMVQRVPGFAIATASQVRGFAGAAGNVLIDGKQPASKNEAVTDVLLRIQASAVERIDLIRGGAPGIDMSGRSVVVNVIRRRASGFRQTASSNAWMFPDGRFLPGFRYDLSRQIGRDQGYEFTVDSNGTYTDAWGRARRTRTSPTEGVFQDIGLDIVGDGRSSNLRGNVKHPLLGGVLQLSANVSRDSFDDLQLLDLPLGNDRFSGRVRSTNGEVSADYSRSLSDAVQGQILLLQRLGTGRSTSSALYSNGFASDFTRRERDGESILRTRVEYKAGPTVDIEAGAEGAYNFLDGRTTYQENGTPIALPSANAKVEEYRGEIFGKADWKISPRLALEAGGRFEVSRIGLAGSDAKAKTFAYPKPRAVLTWNPYENAQLRLRVEREVGQLAFGDFVASAQFSEDLVLAGNVDLEPQREWIFEAAAEQRFWGKGAATFTVRRRAISNAIDFIVINDEFEAIGNIGDGTGWEAVASVTAPLDKIVLPGLTVRANGTWRTSKVTDPLTGDTRRISGQRPFEGSIGFTHDVAGWNLSYGFDANAGWRERSWRLGELTTSSLTHWYRLFAEFKPTPEWSVRAEYVNLDEYRRERILFDGLREQGPVGFIESRVIPPPSRFNVRVRRTF